MLFAQICRSLRQCDKTISTFYLILWILQTMMVQTLEGSFEIDNQDIDECLLMLFENMHQSKFTSKAIKSPSILPLMSTFCDNDP